MNIQTYKVPWHIPEVPAGWGNGYIGLPKDHPWYGKHYDDIDVDVHGGLTYSEDHKPKHEPDGLWWIGFDTGHYQDGPHLTEEYVDHQIANLVIQALLQVS